MTPNERGANQKSAPQGAVKQMMVKLRRCQKTSATRMENEAHRRRATQSRLGNKWQGSCSHEEERSNKQATRFKPRISRVSELNCTTRRRRGKQSKRKSSNGEECFPLTAEVVDSNYMKNIKRNKRIDFRTRAGNGMRSKGR